MTETKTTFSYTEVPQGMPEESDRQQEATENTQDRRVRLMVGGLGVLLLVSTVASCIATAPPVIQGTIKSRALIEDNAHGGGIGSRTLLAKNDITGRNQCIRPPPGDGCYTAASYGTCLVLEHQGCKEIVSTASCPPVFSCADRPSQCIPPSPGAECITEESYDQCVLLEQLGCENMISTASCPPLFSCMEPPSPIHPIEPAPSSQCIPPSPGETCHTIESFGQCLALEDQGCKTILSTRSCPPIHQCADVTSARSGQMLRSSQAAVAQEKQTEPMNTGNGSPQQHCPGTGPAATCSMDMNPVICGTGCEYDNACLANLAGFADGQCRPVAEECPGTGPPATCTAEFAPVKCGANFACEYNNACLANLAGFVETQCLPIGAEIPTPCNPTTGADCTTTPPNNNPTPCNPTTNANCTPEPMTTGSNGSLQHNQAAAAQEKQMEPSAASSQSFQPKLGPPVSQCTFPNNDCDTLDSYQECLALEASGCKNMISTFSCPPQYHCMSPPQPVHPIESQCIAPQPNDDCHTETSYHECLNLEANGCKNMISTASCPPQYQCGSPPKPVHPIESQCIAPQPNDDCHTEESYQECLTLESASCSEILSTLSCPPHYQCAV